MDILQPLPETLRLSELIDSGYSQCFGIQLSHDYQMDDSDFFLFDELDRERWGDTLLTFDAQTLLSKDGSPVRGYASEWQGDHHRLICVGTVDAKKITVNPDELLATSLGLKRKRPRTVLTRRPRAHL
ncbi:hypothetical protein ELI30_27280 (plasmid) [Rhizobium leguminosarum]|uniref:hypothetical protein n=1 Tax=Rhizobium TaxID=379 RepID=UPI00103279E7|nr:MULTISPECIES: hypothetical protein [Rhizobium]TAV45358.1 hypothetical protein ELI31_26200 [Rhizobium leguminosarum]TAV45916.1 hypothetical protein ELI32_27510 [Rhizobium leguminosarum]TAV63771.1 hypothetical protein ELI30_27280 [Rhizobium leguminosarum]TAX05605.1 hypothetical protein ELI07_25425 [Rhizobium leguminosarum]TAX87727.1 hypothetical protein ELH97_25175 [Rhizobium leguminosarum]